MTAPSSTAASSTKRTMSKIYLGLWGLGDSKGFHRGKDPRTAKNEIKAAWRRGIHAFDTAFSYNVDSLLYSALKEAGARTDEAEIIEKVMPVPTFRKKTEASLRALGTERVDWLLLHWPTEDKDLFNALKDAEKMKDEGKALHIGVSNFPTDLIAKVSGDFELEMHERAFSPVWIKDEEKETLPLALYGIFGFGTLFHEERPDDERGKLGMYDSPAEWHALNRAIRETEEKHGVSRAEVLFSFAEKKSGRIIIGSGDHSYLDSGFSLTDDEWNGIYMKALELSMKNGSDNIFSHNWRH